MTASEPAAAWIPPPERDFDRVIARWAASIGLLLLLAIAVPIYHEIAWRSAFAGGHLATHEARVIAVEWDSGDSYEFGQNWVRQDVRVRLTDGTTLTKPDGGEIVDVKEGDQVTVGLWHGDLVGIEGQYVGAEPMAVVFVLPVVVGALVMAALCAVRGRHSGEYRCTPYVAGYVTQSVVLCAIVSMVVLHVLAWWPLVGVLAGAGPPLLIFWWRYGRRTARLRTVLPDG